MPGGTTARTLAPSKEAFDTPLSPPDLSDDDRGLLPGSPAITQAGLAPAGLVQFSGRNIGSQGRGAVAGPVPHPPFNPYVRFSRIRLTDGLLDMVTLPSGIG